MTSNRRRRKLRFEAKPLNLKEFQPERWKCTYFWPRTVAWNKALAQDYYEGGAAPLTLQLGLENLVALVITVLLVTYFAACLIYLRRPEVRARFKSGAGSQPSA